MIKKRIFCIITVIIIIGIFTVNGFASGMTDNISATRYKTFTPIKSMTTTQMLTYTDLNNNMVEKYVTFTEALDNTYMMNDIGDMYYSGFQTKLIDFEPVFNKEDNIQLSKWSVSAEYEANEMFLMKHLSETVPTHNHENKTFTINYIDNEPLFVHILDIVDVVLAQPKMVSAIGSTLEITNYTDIEIYYINEVINGNNKSYYVNHTSYSGDDVEGFLYDLYQTVDYQIVAVTHYSETRSYEIQFDPTQNTWYGFLQIPLKINSENNEYLNISEFLSQTPLGDKLGSTITMGNGGQIDETNWLSNILEAIKTALDVNLFGTISILDILTVIVCIGLTMWLLKVFAGG